jgi:predicted transcriptional regulator
MVKSLRNVKINRMQHRGEIIKKAVNESGFKKSLLAQRLGVKRGTIYNYFDRANVSLDIVLTIGKIIHYDFSRDISELRKYEGADTNSMVVNEPVQHPQYEADYWRDKYYNLLEIHNELLKDLSGRKK